MLYLGNNFVPLSDSTDTIKENFWTEETALHSNNVMEEAVLEKKEIIEVSNRHSKQNRILKPVVNRNDLENGCSTEQPEESPLFPNVCSINILKFYFITLFY